MERGTYGETSKFPTVERQKIAGKHWQSVCESFATSHKKPLHHVSVVLDYYVLYSQRARSVL